MADSSALCFIIECIRGAFPLEADSGRRVIPSATDWENLARSAKDHAVGPLLYASLKNRETDLELPAPILERLRTDFIRSDIANRQALRELIFLQAQFEREKIPAVVLKGGALATTLYPDPALRPMSDLDFLIPFDQFARADACLRDLGFVSPTELRDNFAPRLTNYRAYLRHGKNPAHLELHWHLFKSPYYWRRVPMEWFWDRTALFTIADHPVRGFSPDAQFLHLAAHFALHHRSERLIWSYDLARFCAMKRAALNWDVILDAAEHFGLALAVRAALTSVIQTWGVGAPDAAMAQLNASHPTWRDRAAFALMSAPRGNVRFLLDLLSQPGPQAQAQFLWYHLFPSRAYLRERYPARPRDSNLVFYLRRFADGGWKFFRSLGSILVGR